MSSSSDLATTSTSSGAALLAAAAAALAHPASRRPDSQGRSACRVPGCTEPLVGGYNQKYKICRTHFGAACFRLDDGRAHRFCQQCSRIQPLEDFDGSKLSCRKGLARHTQRRKERQARRAAGEAGSLAGVPDKRLPRAKRALPSPSPPGSGPEHAVPGNSQGSAAEGVSQDRCQRRRMSPEPAGVPPAVPQSPPAVQPAAPLPPVQQQQLQLGPRGAFQRVNAGLQPRHEMRTVLELASGTQPVLTLAKPAAAPAVLPPPAPLQPLVVQGPAPLLTLPAPVAPPTAAPPCSLAPVLLPASRQLESFPSVMLAPVTPHQSLIPDDPFPACSEPTLPAQLGSVPLAAELLLRLLALSLQQQQPVQPPQLVQAPLSTAFLGASVGSLSLSLPPPDSPIRPTRRSAFRRWHAPFAAATC